MPTICSTTRDRNSWGPWIAARPSLSVLLSLITVVVEATTILAALVTPPIRLVFGAAVAMLLIGFALFHNALWLAWWILMLGFVRWEWIDRTVQPSWMRSNPHAPALPGVALVLVLCLVGQQAAASWVGAELPPFLSEYDMYSVTFASPEEFERDNARPRFSILTSTPARDYDVGDCVRRDATAIAELEAALREAAALPPLTTARATVMRCAVKMPGASRVRVMADLREYDWKNGHAGYRYRDRLVAEWPINAQASDAVVPARR